MDVPRDPTPDDPLGPFDGVRTKYDPPNRRELQRQINELQSEIARHYRDFEMVSRLAEEMEQVSFGLGATYAGNIYRDGVRKIRNIVG